MLKAFLHEELVEAGCDEAGRGCLAGPVFAAAVILPRGVMIGGLNDSKKLSERKRKELRAEIELRSIAFAVAQVDQEVIDEINILQASILAMHRAIAQLKVKPAHLLIDGNRFNHYKDIPHTCVIKGDSRYSSIAAASVLAKTYRDDYMEKLHPHFPEYNWKQNKGYPTKHHRQAVMELGLTVHHRQSFNIKK
jgi:ribonuclease HII